VPDDAAAGREARIRKAWALWNDGVRDPAAMGDLAEDFVLESALTGRVFRGVEGLIDWMAEIDGSFDAWRLRIDQLRAVGEDRFLVLGGVHLRGRGSGVEFDQEIGWVIEFDGECVTRLRNFAEHGEAIEAAEGD
jgi:ketosteroid isomerase-like protein